MQEYTALFSLRKPRTPSRKRFYPVSEGALGETCFLGVKVRVTPNAKKIYPTSELELNDFIAYELNHADKRGNEFEPHNCL